MLAQKDQYLVMTLSFMVLSLICSVSSILIDMTDFSQRVLIFMSWVFMGIQIMYLVKMIRYKESTSEETDKE